MYCKINIVFSFILVVIDGAFVTFRVFTKSNLKDLLSRNNVKFLAI